MNHINSQPAAPLLAQQPFNSSLRYHIVILCAMETRIYRVCMPFHFAWRIKSTGEKYPQVNNTANVTDVGDSPRFFLVRGLDRSSGTEYRGTFRSFGFALYLEA